MCQIQFFLDDDSELARHEDSNKTIKFGRPRVYFHNYQDISKRKSLVMMKTHEKKVVNNLKRHFREILNVRDGEEFHNSHSILFEHFVGTSHVSSQLDHRTYNSLIITLFTACVDVVVAAAAWEFL